MSIAQIIAALTAFLALPFIPRAVDAIKGVATDRGRQKLSEIERANARADRAEEARDKAIAERDDERDACDDEKAQLREQLRASERREAELAMELQRVTGATAAAVIERDAARDERDHARDEVQMASDFVDAMLDRKPKKK